MIFKKSSSKRIAFLCLLSLLILIRYNSISQEANSLEHKAKEILKEALELYQNGKYIRAIGKFSSITYLSKDKKIIRDAYLYLSLCYFALGESESAKDHIKKLLAIYPEMQVSKLFYPNDYVVMFDLLLGKTEKKGKEIELLNEKTKRINVEEKDASEEFKKYDSLTRNLKKKEEIKYKGAIFPLQSVDVAPIVVKTIAPRFSRDYLPILQTWKIIVNVLISENGEVENVKIIGGIKVHHEVRKAVINAVRQWKFKPAIKDGVKVKVWKPVAVRISYALK